MKSAVQEELIQWVKNASLEIKLVGMDKWTERHVTMLYDFREGQRGKQIETQVQHERIKTTQIQGTIAASLQNKTPSVRVTHHCQPESLEDMDN